jgi:hypothetical protein
VLADQPNAPGERVRPGARHPGVDEGVEHPAFVVPQPGHHRNREVGEEQPGVADRRAPGHLASVARLGLVGDAHPGVPGVLAEPPDPALGRGAGSGVLAVRRREFADDDDLLAVDGDRRSADEPVVRQPAAEPGDDVVDRRQVGLLPPAATALSVVSAHQNLLAM